MCHWQRLGADSPRRTAPAARIRFDTPEGGGDNARVAIASLGEPRVTASARSHSAAAGARDHAQRAYAGVALLPAVPGKDLLTYRVPDALRARLRPGVRVVVPLGRRRETGIVVALSATAPADLRLRSVERALDDEPIVTPELFALCRWAADYYMTSLADVLAAALPGGLRATGLRVVRIAAEPAGAPHANATEAAILDWLRVHGPASTRRIARALGGRRVERALARLAEIGVVVVEEALRAPAAKTKLVTLFAATRALTADEERALRRAPRQHTLHARIAAAPEARIERDALGAAERVAADALVRRGILERVHAERYRGTLRQSAASPPPVLTAEQQAAVDGIVASSGFQPFLLHGVTGSGKTEVYLHAAARTIAAGRSVLLLVPEIALTHQLVLRVQQRFGSGVALLHSGLTPGERWDEWRRCARGEARLVVGARSAVFAPLADLGLVVVDEEHDPAFKQDEGLRYNARDLALVRAKLAGTAAILGSATPGVEAYRQALDGKFRLLRLRRRVEDRPLPPVTLVDVRQPANRMTGLFSPPLVEAIRATLERREQTLLFLNRRGFARSLQCLECGEPAGCPSCSVSLTYHRRRGILLCHHCGYARPAAEACTGCGRGPLQSFADGTERVEADVAELFPDARVGRLDRDTTARRGSQRRILDALHAGELDILIGTQMITKGHDVPGVTLVGVLLADLALNMPDFRAAERTFQLLTQVAGRAGRGRLPGTVLVQTFRPHHHSLRAAAAHDYDTFAERELEERREVAFPPFSRLAVLRLEAEDAHATERAATAVAARARDRAGDAVVVRGPAPAPLERLRNRYRWQVMLTSPHVGPLHRVIRDVVSTARAASATRGIRLVVDVDPVSML